MRCSSEADAALGEPLSQLCFDGPEDRLVLTENTQPAILTVSIAAARLARDCAGFGPQIVAGHSLGEYSAHVAAGTLRLCRCRAHRPAARAVHAGGGAGGHRRDGRGARPGGRRGGGGLRGGRRRARSSRRPISMRPARSSLPGPWPAVQRAGERAKARGAKRVIALPVSAPFHCALMSPAQDRLAPELRALTVVGPAGAGRGQRRRRAEDRRRGEPSRRWCGRSRRRSGGKTSSGGLRRLASARMLKWVRAQC